MSEYKRRSALRDSYTETEVNLLRAASAASVASGATDRSGKSDNCVEEYVCDVPFAAMARVADVDGNLHSARLLLDNGSTSNFITQDLCGKLGLTVELVLRLTKPSLPQRSWVMKLEVLPLSRRSLAECRFPSTSATLAIAVESRTIPLLHADVGEEIMLVDNATLSPLSFS
ncbi:unnamed protein product [Plutella xylostella]|uniref:(diamondback moth) hypothetical protein n=1 Tax=Plutella xylostella TaxID=51655 RepID=A0A8S4GAI5_PLUXY|nr:unnamed protein product [Plutella xylostella]